MTIEKQFVAVGVRQVRYEQYLNKELKRAGYGGMGIIRTPHWPQGTRFAEKPGIVIRQGGRLGCQITTELTPGLGCDSPPG